jgi:predicted alpha/beta hydrolase family esterase
MRSFIPTRPTTLSVLLALLLAQPLQAEESDSASTETSPETVVETPRAPLPERSEVDASALQQRLAPKEQQQLQAADEEFLSLWLPANVATPSGAVIILPGDDESADWPQSVGPLRRKLPDAGWHSLSLTLPDPASDAPTMRRTVEPVAISDDATDATTDEQTTASDEATAADAPAEVAAIDAPEPPVEQTPEERQKAHAERVMARIDAAIAFAQQQKAGTLVLLGHGSGAYWAARYLAERKPEGISNLLLVAAQLPKGFGPGLEELVPQLQLATGDFYYKDLPADRQAALKRSQASKRQKHPAYIQVAMKALPGNREAEQEQLYRRIKGWLSLKVEAK